MDANLVVMNLDVGDFDADKGECSTDADCEAVLGDADVVGKGVDDAEIEV